MYEIESNWNVSLEQMSYISYPESQEPVDDESFEDEIMSDEGIDVVPVDEFEYDALEPTQW